MFTYRGRIRPTNALRGEPASSLSRAQKCTLRQSDLPVEIISRYSAWQEVYSIDESFVGLRGEPEELELIGAEIRRTVWQLTGVPVRVAMGATKSLAKVAAIGIKKTPAMNGVLHLGRYGTVQMDRILDSIPVTDLWGVAGRTGRSSPH